MTMVAEKSVEKERAEDKTDFDPRWVVYSPSRNLNLSFEGYHLTDSIIYTGVFTYYGAIALRDLWQSEYKDLEIVHLNDKEAEAVGPVDITDFLV